MAEEEPTDFTESFLGAAEATSAKSLLPPGETTAAEEAVEEEEAWRWSTEEGKKRFSWVGGRAGGSQPRASAGENFHQKFYYASNTYKKKLRTFLLV